MKNPFVDVGNNRPRFESVSSLGRGTMAVKIPLAPIVSKPDAAAHGYPFQISIQTQEFLQATLLHASFVDIAAGQAVRSPGGLEKIERQYIDCVGSKATYDEAWSYLTKYRHVFEKTALQSVLVALNSHWDWYIRKLGEFVLFARAEARIMSSASEEKSIRRLGVLPLLDQIDVLENSLGVSLPFSEAERMELEEMSLVRNLGLHNRWEVDEKYLSQTPRRGLQSGELRIVEVTELHHWHGLMIRLINSSCSGVARTYRSASSYPQ